MIKCAVVGGGGALGRQLVAILLKKECQVVSVDLAANNQATYCVTIAKPLSDPKNLETASKAASAHGPFDAVFCVAGGWQGGSSTSSAFIQSTVAMWEMNVLSATLTASLASVLSPSGLMVFTSAKASLGPTPGMLGYGMAKAATNHLITSLADQITCVGMLPVTLDTEMNRKAMPDADFTTWTPLDVLANKMCEWAMVSENRPKSGSLVIVETTSNGTTFTS
jgi:dihydropteridine reductase